MEQNLAKPPNRTSQADLVGGRRSQEERSSTTRQSINEATIHCLITVGYSGTTLLAVASQAGLSRGAVTHHYASKQEMLVAAIDHLSRRVAGDLRDASRHLDDTGERVTQVMRLLWQSFTGDLFAASLEMWVAARTDPALMHVLVKAERSLGQRNRALLADMFGPQIAAAPAFDRALDTTFNLMRGVAVTGIVRQNSDRERQLVDDWAELFTELVSAEAGIAITPPTENQGPTPWH